MKKILFLLACACLTAGAQNSRVKFDVDGRSQKIPFAQLAAGKELRAEHASWIKDETDRQNYLIVNTVGSLTDAWRNFEFSFVPQKDGIVSFNLRSMFKNQDGWAWTAYRNIEITGAEYKDNEWRTGPGRFQDTPDGKVFYAAHDASTVRNVQVTKGQQVTVRFQAQAGPFLKPKEVPLKIDPFDAPPPAIASNNKPKEYYRYYGAEVKLLPLSDKGHVGEHIRRHPRDPGRDFGRELPIPVFKTSAQKAAPDTGGTESIAVELLEEAGVARNAAVRFGFPLAAGALFSPDRLRVLDPNGKEVPAQVSITSNWPDQSIKWALVQFNAPLKANEKAVYRVEAGKDVKRTAASDTLKVRKTDRGYEVSTGQIQANVGECFLENVIYNGKNLGGLDRLTLTTENGDTVKAGLTDIALEEEGSEVVTFRLKGKLGKYADYVARVRFYANSAAVYCEITYINTNLENEFTDFTALSLDFIPQSPLSAFTMNGSETASLPARYFQSDEATLNGRKGELGAVQFTDRFAISIRDAAKRYPKGLAVESGKVGIELLPALPSPEFGRELPHYLQFPFAGGKYRMKWGMAFTEKLYFDFSGRNSAVADAENNLPVLAVLPQDWYFRTRTMQGVSAAGDHSFDDYDKQVTAVIDEHLKYKEKQREFGFLNYGDWYGERGRNWGNNEYDLAHGAFVHFLRTGNRKAARLASLATQHQADVDIVQAYPDPYYVGANAQHAIGHTGVSYQRVKQRTWSYRYDASYSAENGHTWTRGMVKEWLLNGNARVMSSALMLGEHICYFMAPNFRKLGTHERSAGWSLTAIMGLYDAISDPLYLESARHIADVAMNEQNFEKGGAWPHVMPSDHGGGHKDTFGNCPYLVGILLEGLGQYHRVSQDPRAAKSIIAGAGWLVTAWSSYQMSWPYGVSWDGKPYNSGAPGLNLLIAPAVIYAANLSNDEKMFEIASLVMNNATFKGMNAAGKALSMDVATVAGLIDGLSRWNNAHPAKRYLYHPTAVMEQAFTGNFLSFKLRAPDHKEFRIQLHRDNPEITVSRIKHGARPQGKPEGSLVFKDASGKVLLSEQYPTAEAFEKKFAVPGKKGDVVALEIDDDLTALWDIPATNDYTPFALMDQNSTIGSAGLKGYYFTIPANTSEFTFYARGVHAGSFGAQLVDDQGNNVAIMHGVNIGQHRLPWLDYRKSADPVQKKTITLTPQATPRIWRVLVWAAGDMSFYFENIPSAIAISPSAYPGGAVLPPTAKR